MSLVSAILTLFLVMDPLGNIPLYLSALRDVPQERVKRVIVRELLIALVILLLFLFAGAGLLSLMHVSQESLNVGGGMILLMIAIRMIFPVDENHDRARQKDEPFIVPLAIPYTAGPSVMATEMLLMSQAPDLWARWLTALIIAWGISAVILYSSASIRRIIGNKGLTAMERLMGMILVFLSMEMLMSGIKDFFF